MIGSCAGTKVTFAPVRFSNSARTFLKLACSVPVHTAATDELVPSSLGRFRVLPFPCAPALGEELLSLSLSSSPPHAESVSARAPARSVAAALTVLRVRMVLLVLRITAPFFVLVERSSAVPWPLVYAGCLGSARARTVSSGRS